MGPCGQKQIRHMLGHMFYVYCLDDWRGSRQAARNLPKTIATELHE